MTIIRNLALGVALGLTFSLATTAVQAQDERPIISITREPLLPAPSDEGLARRNALARELIDLSSGPNFLKAFETMIDQQLAGIDSKGGEEAAWVRTNMPPMLSRMVVRLLDQMAPTYAAIYSEEELQAQIAFYRTPVGRAVAAKSVALGAAVQDAQTTVLAGFMTELESKYCARFDCGDPGRTAGKPAR
jgi:hypothetical protein